MILGQSASDIHDPVQITWGWLIVQRSATLSLGKAGDKTIDQSHVIQLGSDDKNVFCKSHTRAGAMPQQC